VSHGVSTIPDTGPAPNSYLLLLLLVLKLGLHNNCDLGFSLQVWAALAGSDESSVFWSTGKE
jgi:hypothetical protein